MSCGSGWRAVMSISVRLPESLTLMLGAKWLNTMHVVAAPGLAKQRACQ